MKLNTEMISPRKKNNPYTTKPIIATTVAITFDVTRISGAEVRFLVVDVSPFWFTINSLLLFSVLSSTVWFTSLQMQTHDVVFITICVTLFVVVDVIVVIVVGIVAGNVVLVGVLVIKDVVVVIGVVIFKSAVVVVGVVVGVVAVGVIVVIDVGVFVVIGVVIVVFVVVVAVAVEGGIHTSGLVIGLLLAK